MTKLKSKLERLKIRDDIESFLKKLPLKDMEESQIGDYIYSGKGKMYVGSRSIPVKIRIKIMDGGIVVTVSSPLAGILVKCPFEPVEAAKSVRQEIKKSFN